MHVLLHRQLPGRIPARWKRVSAAVAEDRRQTRAAAGRGTRDGRL